MGYVRSTFYSPVFQPFLSEQVCKHVRACVGFCIGAFLMQFHLEPLQVGLVYFGGSAIYLISAFFIGPLSDRLVRALPPKLSTDNLTQCLGSSVVHCVWPDGNIFDTIPSWSSRIHCHSVSLQAS